MPDAGAAPGGVISSGAPRLWRAPMTPLSRFNPAQPGAAGMKAAATGLLVVMAGDLPRRARTSSPTYPWLGFVKAFAEAAMVGGLADWFAVTALFRHPLGLPIPHTAIIPRNKDRIGETLASFLNDNFLIPSVVARRMRNIDVAGAAGRFLKAPPGEGTRIRQGASRLIADIFESLDDERLGGIVKGAISSRLRAMEVSPLLGHALASAINEDRHVPMLEAAIRWTARALDANEPLIRDMVKKKANWALKLAGLDAKLADAIIDGLAQADRGDVDRSRPSGAGQGRGSARPARQRPADQPGNPRAGRGDEGRSCSTTSRSACGSTPCGRRAARRSSAPRAIPTRCWPASSAKCSTRWARRSNPTRASARAINQFARRAVAGTGGKLWRLDRQAGVRHGPRLGRADGHRAAGKRGRPRPPVYPHQRHPGRRAGRAYHPRARPLLTQHSVESGGSVGRSCGGSVTWDTDARA